LVPKCGTPESAVNAGAGSAVVSRTYDFGGAAGALFG
jgi:hypothetical protein